MIAFKLFRKLKNGELRPLFINKTQKIELNKLLHAKEVPTKGYKIRKGWHCLPQPVADHLSKKDRVWCIVKMYNYKKIDRPENQGGTWYVAQKIIVLGEISMSFELIYKKH